MTVAITSGKGGVGKTSVAANVAAALSTAGRRVLLVDADLGLANLDIVLGLEPKHTIADVLAGDCDIRDVLLKAPAGLTLLPASSGISELTDLDDGRRASLLASIESVERDFDVVILDCAAGVGADVQLFGGIADEVLVVATPDPTSLTDAYALMKVLHTKRGRRTFRIVSSQVTSEVQAKKVFKVLAMVSDMYLDLRVDLLGWIPHDDHWRRAVLERRLAFASHPSSPGSRQVAALADRLIAIDRANDNRAGIGGLLLGGAT